MTRPVEDWETQQTELRQQRVDTAADSIERMRIAGQKRGSRGQIDSPPWTNHMHELFPGVPPTTVEGLLGAHRYGMTEGYVEHAHDLISDEFTPRAEAIAKQADRARNMMEGADAALRAKGVISLGGRRGISAPTVRRARVAHARFGEVQGQADALQGELQGRLDQVETMRGSLATSKWQPRS